MSQLTDLQLADVIRRTGWPQPMVPAAVATALAASGGRASYRHKILPGPSAHYVGLWGLDVLEFPQHAGADLTNPYVASKVAWELTERREGFGWCPAWRSGAYVPYVERGTAVVSRVMTAETEHVPLVTDRLPSFMHAAHVALAPVLARLGRPSNRSR